MKRFFETLYMALARGARAVLQCYPENASQAELLVSSAMKVREYTYQLDAIVQAIQGPDMACTTALIKQSLGRMWLKGVKCVSMTSAMGCF